MGDLTDEDADDGGPELSGEHRRRGLELIILRHLHDGDVIEWPVPEDHRLRATFDDLESRSLIARWDRIWPLRDRYRLTEAGIARIEEVYRPDEAEETYAMMRERRMSPAERRRYLREHGRDPYEWCIVHDQNTHWETWDDDDDCGPWFGYVWEDSWTEPDSVWTVGDGVSVPPPPPPPAVVDLDRDAAARSVPDPEPGLAATDLS